MSKPITVTTQLLTDPIFDRRCLTAEFDISFCSAVTRCIVTQKKHILLLVNSDVRMHDTIRIDGKRVIA